MTADQVFKRVLYGGITLTIGAMITMFIYLAVTGDASFIEGR